MWASSRSIATGVGFSPRSFIRAAMVPFSAVRSERKAAMSGSAGSGAGVRSSRWKTPPEAAARSAVIAETMLPAAPVTSTTDSDVSGIPPSSPVVRRPARRAGNGCSSRAMPKRCPSTRPTSTQPGSRRVSSTSRSATAAVLRSTGRSTALTRAPGRSFLYDLVKPVTAPPSTEVAPAVEYPW